MAITASYLWPASASASIGGLGGSSANPATVTQMQNYNMCIATIASSAAGDNSAIITHDLNLAATEISAGFPRVVINPQADDTTSDWYVVSQNPNYTILGANTLAAKPTTLFTIDRPVSLDR